MKKIGSNAFLKASGGLAGLLVLLAILIAANVILGNLRWRTDLTEEGLFTLSTGTRDILKKLDTTVTLKLFSNCDAPEAPVHMKNYAAQVEDLLNEYRIVSRGKVTIEKYDPSPDSDAEDWARRYGIGGRSAGMFGPPLYLGLVAVCGESEGVLPALDPQTQGLLEYNITRLIYRAIHPEKPVVGLLSSLPVLGMQPPPYAMPGQPRPQPKPAWLAIQDLKQDYDIREVPATAETIDDDLMALIVVHPKDLSEPTLYAIDQYVLKGGRVLAFLDPLSVADMESNPAPGMMPGMSQNASNLEKLLTAWGVGYEADKCVADLKSVSPVRGMNNQVEESPVFLTLRSDRMSAKDVLTSGLDMVMMPFAGAFTDRTSDDLSFTPLITSSDSSWLVDAMSAQFGSQALRNSMKGTGMEMHLAVRLHGKFKTAFPDGKPAPAPDPNQPDGEAPKPPEEEAGSAGLQEGDSSVILVGDVDMLYDRFCIQEMNFFGTKAHQPLNDNLNLLANAVEQIGGSSDLIGIRSRGTFHRPFTRVLALELEARRQWQSKEDDLVQELQQAQQKLRDLESEKDTQQRFILSKEQQQAIARFRDREIEIKQELKEVRKKLRSDIERLGVKVKVINIALVPLLVSLAGVGFGLYRRKNG